MTEKVDIQQKSNQNLFGKNFSSCFVENVPRKEHGRCFLVEIVVLLFLLKSPSRQALHWTATNRTAEGNFITLKKQSIKRDIARNMVANKTINGAVVSQVSKVLNQKLAALSRKYPKLNPEVSNKCSPLSKKNCLLEKFQTCNWQED